MHQLLCNCIAAVRTMPKEPCIVCEACVQADIQANRQPRSILEKQWRFVIDTEIEIEYKAIIKTQIESRLRMRLKLDLRQQY